MSNLTDDNFDAFFQALHHRGGDDGGRPAYSWQKRLAERAITGDWPPAIDLPTGSGKTACIDVAVYALACQAARPIERRTAPRRVFFCVNRRVVVDEAYERAKRIARRLVESENEASPRFPILKEVAQALRKLARTMERTQAAPPIDVLELRGGIYRDNRWARSAAQPTIVCTTIDQLGSRLLFRGYGVSSQAAPIQAALIAYDSLVLLDEAHISQPFLQTLQQAGCYLNPERWTEQSIGPRPMIVVPMTAAPPKNIDRSDVLGLDDEDRRTPSLDARLQAGKPATLEAVADVRKAIIARAGTFARNGPVAVGIIVNRVAAARDIYADLRKNHPDAEVELVIGAMRPIDRDRQAVRLALLVGPGRPTPAAKTSFVVATQCLEVGADYDFDVLVTECASLDALRQRFGRLNRAGRAIGAQAVIVMKEKDVKSEDAIEKAIKPLDPIYGDALARTWNWLWEHATVERPPEGPGSGPDEPKPGRGKGEAKPDAESRIVDFGVNAFNALLMEHGGDERMPERLLAPSAAANAPVMLPAYVDFWCQTSPVPVPDPDVALFLHGPQHQEPDVQICWRADLVEDGVMRRDHWPDVVALAPPSSPECLTVPLSRMRRWLADKKGAAIDRGDLLEVAEAGEGEEIEDASPERVAVLWRGAEKSRLIQTADDLRLVRPGDTIVLPVEKGGQEGWNQLGHIPEWEQVLGDASDEREAKLALLLDVAEEAFRIARDRRVLRLHPSLASRLPDNEHFRSLLERIADHEEEISIRELREVLSAAADDFSEEDSHHDILDEFAETPFIKPYPDRRGFVLTSRRRLQGQGAWFLPALDDGDDDASRIAARAPISLKDHSRHVRDVLAGEIALLHTTISRRAFELAAGLHDWGKADERFQAMLLGGSRTDAWLWPDGRPSLLAKSDGMPMSPAERKAVRERAGLPAGFRHEMLSVQLAERADLADLSEADRDLVLHLIAAHHGHARPFAPVVLDDDPPETEHGGILLTSDDRRRQPPHRLDSGVAERFWALTRRYGWWGLAYFEALLRLADQQASADEDAGKSEPSESPPFQEAQP